MLWRRAGAGKCARAGHSKVFLYWSDLDTGDVHLSSKLMPSSGYARMDLNRYRLIPVYQDLRRTSGPTCNFGCQIRKLMLELFMVPITCNPVAISLIVSLSESERGHPAKAYLFPSIQRHPDCFIIRKDLVEPSQNGRNARIAAQSLDVLVLNAPGKDQTFTGTPSTFPSARTAIICHSPFVLFLFFLFLAPWRLGRSP